MATHTLPDMKKLLLLFFVLAVTAVRASDEDIMAYHLSSQQGSLPNNNVRKIYQDSAGFMYFHTLYGTYRYDGYSFSEVPDSVLAQLNSTAERQFRSIGKERFRDNRGNLVAIHEDSGLLEHTDRTTGETIRFTIFGPGLKKETDNLKCRVLTDNEGRVWASVNGNGLFVYDRRQHSLRHITKDSPGKLIGNNYVVYMTADRDGNIWAAVQNQGVTCLRVVPSQYVRKHIGNDDAEWAQDIKMMTRLPGGDILIANKRKLFRADPLLHRVQEVASPCQNVLAAATDSEGRLWLGTRLNGVFVDGKGYGHGRVNGLLPDGKGRMWKCGIKSLVAAATLTAGGTYSERTFRLGADSLIPRTLAFDRQGRMLVGAETGLYRFTPDSLLADSSRYERLLAYPVYCLFTDSRGRLWIGTHGHGALHDDGRGGYKQIASVNGLTDNNVQSISEDATGRICIATQSGCAYYSPGSGGMHYLAFHNDLSMNFFNENCAIRLDDGRMLFGTVGGLVIVDRDFKPAIPPVALPSITNIEVDGVSVSELPGKMSPQGITATKSIKLRHNENTVTLRFSNFNYMHLAPTSFSYMLEGYDDDWSVPSELNFATYKNLPPGKYVFKVRCMGGDGRWTEGESLLTLTVLPPWWLTWWAFMLYAALLAIGAVLVFRYLRTLYRLRRDIAVEKRLTQFKLDFFTNISHELRTPLTLIYGNLERIRQVGGSIGDLRQPIDRMKSNVNRMLRLVNQLLEFRKMQEDRLQLSLEMTEVVGFLRNIVNTFHDTAESRRVALQFLPQSKRHEAFVDRGYLDKIAYELLNNAMKYTPPGGSVELRLKTEPGRMQVIVADTGIGVPEDKRSTIFDRYSHGNHRRDSLGIGLNLVAGLVETHHGTITLGDNPGGGSVFTVTLPTGKEEYKESDFMAEGGDVATDNVAEGGFAEPVGEMTMPPMNDRRVLVVEDDDDVRAYLNHELGRYFCVDTATDGQDALERIGALADGADYDLVVSDVMMPRMNGLELCGRLRSGSRTCAIPIILLTALGDVDRQAKGLEAGADAYIVKPFSMQLLLAHCRRLLERGAGTALQPSGDSKKAKTVAPQIITDERYHKLKERFAAYADAHLADPGISAESFADGMGMSRTVFFAKFKALTGSTPNEYIREQRLQRAAEMLSSGPVTAAEVAYQVGMKTPQYFSTCFKKRFGVTPAQWQAGVRATQE